MDCPKRLLSNAAVVPEWSKLPSFLVEREAEVQGSNLTRDQNYAYHFGDHIRVHGFSHTCESLVSTVRCVLSKFTIVIEKRFKV